MAVYTSVSDADIGRLEVLYALPHPVQLKPIAEGVENSNYLLTDGGGKRAILTLYEQRVEARDLPFFMALMQFLAGQGVPCPLPVRTQQGEMITEIAGRKAAMVSFLEGKSSTRIQPAHCREVGQHLAKMHIASAQFTTHRRSNALGVEAWPLLWQKIHTKAAQTWPDAVLLVESQLARLGREWPRDLPRGIIHADLFPDNVFFEGETLSGLIDFYFACNDLLAFDLAICLNAWCFEQNREFNITKSQRMLEGYCEIRLLSDAEKAAFPLLCTGAALRFLLTRMTDWLNPRQGALVTPKNPLEYLARLKFHAGAERFSAYGLG